MPELNDQKLPWSLEPRASVTETPKTLVEEALEQVEQENERLRAALQKLYDGLAWDWRGHPVGDLPTLREIARAALAKMEKQP